MSPQPPKIPDTPGIIWRPRADGWEARWQCRTDLVKKGFEPKSQRLWVGTVPTEVEAKAISDACNQLQGEMLVFSRGGLPEAGKFDGSLRSLINCYQTDRDSTYHKLRYHVRIRHDQLLRRIAGRYGDTPLTEIRARAITAWHRDWTDDGVKLATGHAFAAQLRVLFGFGLKFLEDEDCERLSVVMSKMRFASPKPREERMTFDQVAAVRAEAHKQGWHSIAIGQAMQFECILRQKDVIGEWVPFAEPGVSEIRHHGRKWLRGLRWSEIDANMILRHVTSKKDKPLEFDLRLSPPVMEEFRILAGVAEGETVTREMLPASGPMLVSESTQRPWLASQYRSRWRKIATAAGVPAHVFNMDSRAGGITEATDAGADLEHVRHAATHSNIAMTQRYSRGAPEKVAKVMRIRVDSRRTKKEGDD